MTTTSTTIASKAGAALTGALLATASVPALALTTEGVTLTILRAPEVPAVLAVPREAVAGERFEAGPNETVEVLFADGTSVVLAPGSALAVAAFSYDPETRTGQLRLRLERGLARIAGGALNNTAPIVVETPSGTVELDNATAFVEVRPDGATRASLVLGRRLTLTSGGETRELDRPGFELVALAADRPPSDPVRQEPGAARADAEALHTGGAVVAFTVNGDVAERVGDVRLIEPAAGPEQLGTAPPSETTAPPPERTTPPPEATTSLPPGTITPPPDTTTPPPATTTPPPGQATPAPGTTTPPPGQTTPPPGTTTPPLGGTLSGSLGLSAGDTLTGTIPDRSQGSDAKGPRRSVLQDRLPIRRPQAEILQLYTQAADDDEFRQLSIDEDFLREAGPTLARFYGSLTGQPFTQIITDAGNPNAIADNPVTLRINDGPIKYTSYEETYALAGESFDNPPVNVGFGSAVWLGNVLATAPLTGGIEAPFLLPRVLSGDGRIGESSVADVCTMDDCNVETAIGVQGLIRQQLEAIRNAFAGTDPADSAARIRRLVTVNPDPEQGALSDDVADRIVANLPFINNNIFADSDDLTNLHSPLGPTHYRYLQGGFAAAEPTDDFGNVEIIISRSIDNFFLVEAIPAKITKTKRDDLSRRFAIVNSAIVDSESGQGTADAFRDAVEGAFSLTDAQLLQLAQIVLAGDEKRLDVGALDGLEGVEDSVKNRIIRDVNEVFEFEPFPESELTARFLFAAGDVDELDHPNDANDRRELGLSLDRFFLTPGLEGFEEIGDHPGTASGIRAFLRNETALGLEGQLADTGLLVVNRPAHAGSPEEQRSPLLHADFGLVGASQEQRSTISVTLGEVMRKQTQEIAVSAGFEFPGYNPNDFVIKDADGTNIFDSRSLGENESHSFTTRNGIVVLEIFRANDDPEIVPLDTGATVIPRDADGDLATPLPEGTVYRRYEVTLEGGHTVASSRVPTEEGDGSGGADRAATLITSPLAITASGGGNPELAAIGRPGYLVLENFDVECNAQGCSPKNELAGGIEKPLTTPDGPKAEQRYALLRLGTAVGSEVPERADGETTLEGFAAGISEFQAQGLAGIGVAGLGSGVNDGLVIVLDPNTNRVAATLNVTGRDTSKPLNVALGGLDDGAAGRSAYIDGDTFAARSSGTGGVEVALVTGTDLRDGLPAELRAPIKETYQHLQWGFFFGDISVATVNNALQREHVHLGTWAAGSPVDPSRLPTRGTATYAGHAIGNVFNGNALYTALGTYRNQWDFAARGGTVEMALDGASYSGLTQLDNGRASFVGSLQGAGRAGNLRGLFVDNGTTAAGNPPGGVVGRFELGGGTYGAAGTFGAELQP